MYPGGGYQALKRIVGADGGAGLTQDEVIAIVKGVCSAWSGWRWLSNRVEVELHAT